MDKIQINGLQYFVIIADQKKKKKFLNLLNDYEARGIETVYAHGSMSPSAIASAFGFETAQNKIMISCLLKHSKATELMNILYTNHKFNEPNTGFAFSIPVEGIAF